MVYKKVKTVTYTITAGVALCDPVGIFSIDVSIGGCDFGLERASSIAANEELALEICMADWHLCYRAILDPRVVLRGVAVCIGRPESIKGPLLLEAHRIIREVWDYCDTILPQHVPILFHAFLGEFRTRLPRGVIGDGCWKVQFKGLRACVSCPYEKNLFCPGKSIVRTGTNDVGMDIPILN